MKPVFLFGNLHWRSNWYDTFTLISARYTVKFTDNKWNCVY